MIKHIFITLLLIFCLCSTAWGATYYVSQSGGDDTNNGTAIGTPWKELDVIEDKDLSTGDKVLLLCGDTWDRNNGDWGSGEYEILVTDSITIGAYMADGTEVDGDANT